MASTNKTTNYELSQFIETDRPAWLTDYNGDMRTIDSTMKAISDVASGASGSISELADRMSTAEGNITTNTNDIDALEARTDALEARETSADGRLDALEAEQIVQNTAIESNTRLGYNLARPYDSASTYAVGEYVLFQDTLYKCTSAIATGEAFDPSKWLAVKATDSSATKSVSINDVLFIDTNDIATNISGEVYISNNIMFLYASIQFPAQNIPANGNTGFLALATFKENYQILSHFRIMEKDVNTDYRVLEIHPLQPDVLSVYFADTSGTAHNSGTIVKVNAVLLLK